MLNLDEFLSIPGAVSMAEFARALNLNADQVRQWRYGTDKRRPSPENCVAIEQATGRRVMRWNLRPDDWHRIWPELIDAAGAPAVPEVAKAGA